MGSFPETHNNPLSLPRYINRYSEPSGSPDKKPEGTPAGDYCPRHGEW